MIITQKNIKKKNVKEWCQIIIIIFNQYLYRMYLFISFYLLLIIKLYKKNLFFYLFSHLYVSILNLLMNKI